jgi:hypothetical protein
MKKAIKFLLWLLSFIFVLPKAKVKFRDVEKSNTEPFIPKKRRVGVRNSTRTKKQQKARAASKLARKARKNNRFKKYKYETKIYVFTSTNGNDRAWRIRKQ